jgi:tetratricopeptide (TPR) repeat protein
LLPNIAVDRLGIDLSISCVLILATCALVLVTIALHPSYTALAIRTKSTEALRYFDKILAINPKNITALTSKGIALNYLGNHTGAILYYDKALAIDPKNICALNDKGIALNYTESSDELCLSNNNQ